jgi:hypothetical protein
MPIRVVSRQLCSLEPQRLYGRAHDFPDSCRWADVKSQVTLAVATARLAASLLVAQLNVHAEGSSDRPTCENLRKVLLFEFLGVVEDGSHVNTSSTPMAKTDR